jgi:hypothetical protein
MVKAVASLFLGFAVMIPFAILGKILGGGLIAVFIFSPLYYALAWKLGMLKDPDPVVIFHGIIPLINLMGTYALLIIFIHDRLLKGDINIFLGKKKG